MLLILYNIFRFSILFLLTYYFGKFMFDVKLNKKNLIYYILVSTIMLTIDTLIFRILKMNPVINIILNIILYSFILLYFFKLKNKAYAFLISGFMFFLMGLANFVDVLIFLKMLKFSYAYMQSSIYFTFISDCIGYILILITILFAKNYYKYKYFLTNNFKRNIIISYFPIILFLILFYIFLNKDFSSQILILILGIILFITNILYMVLNYILFKSSKENNDMKIYIETIEQLSIELRRFKHDYLNILQSLKGYTQLKKYNELEQYLNQIIQESSIIKDSYYFELQKIKNPALFSLIAFKIKKSQEKNIKLHIDINDDIDDININAHDLCEIIGIFLDNAIEALENEEQKVLHIEIKNSSELIYIKIKNTFTKSIRIDQLDSLNYSTKGKNRGLGLYVVKKLICRYGNIINNTIIKDKNFIQELYIKG